MVNLLKSIVEDPRVKQLGPGLITGAADDDPSGIATYSQAGAQFGYSMLWTVLFTYPLMVGIQMVSARLGCITGRGLAANVKAVFPRSVLYGIVGLLLIANTINIAADIAAMGEALRLLLGGSAHLYSVGLGVLCLGLQVFLRYADYVRLLKWLTLALLSYVAVIFTVHVHWGAVISEMVMPRLVLNHNTITMIVAVFGTTISPYLFFWQAAQEMEDLRAITARNGGGSLLPHAEEVARKHLRRIRWDTYVGMGFSNLIAFFIILSTAATLHAAGIVDIQTSSQAAEALRPLGGQLGDHRHGNARRAGAGGLGRVCGGGELRLAVGHGYEVAPSTGVLRHHRHRDGGRRGLEFHASGPDARAGMERRNQRRHRSPHHVDHDAACLARGHHGAIRDPTAIAPSWVDRHRGDGADCRGHDRHDVTGGVR
jgi:hypothetical protein